MIHVMLCLSLTFSLSAMVVLCCHKCTIRQAAPDPTVAEGAVAGANVPHPEAKTSSRLKLEVGWWIGTIRCFLLVLLRERRSLRVMRIVGGWVCLGGGRACVRMCVLC